MNAANIGEPETVDPGWAYDTTSGELIFNVYDTLIFPNHEKPFEFEPHLADSWTIPDALTYRFHIRTGVRWHDAAFGTVTPRDVEYSFERNIVMDYTAGPMWLLIQPLLNAWSTRDWDLADGTQALELVNKINAAVQVVDASGAVNPSGEWVQFNLAEPYAPFMQVLCQTWSSIIDREWASAVTWDGTWPTTEAGAVALFAAYNDPEVSPFDSPAHIMMGSGPYKFKAWVLEQYWEIERFPDFYLGWPAVGCADYVSLVTMKLVPSWAPRKQLFLSNMPEQADLIAVPRNAIEQVITVPGVRGAAGLPGISANAFFMNYAVAPTSAYPPKLNGTVKLDLMSDIHMRRAFSHVLNFTEYLSTVYMNEAVQPANPVISSLRPYYWADAPRATFDLDAMKAEFLQAWNGQVWSGGFTINLVYAASSTLHNFLLVSMIENAVENLIPEGWPEGVAVDVIPTQLGWVSIIQHLNEMPTWSLGWLADYADPDNFAKAFMDPYGGDFWAFVQWQSIQYGQSGHMQLDWGTFGDPALPIDDTYVSLLIEEGVKRVGFDERYPVYLELQRIWFDEMPSIMLSQPLVRHWERDWVQGWYYNPIYPGYYFYHLWKGLDMDMTGRDVNDPVGKQKGYVDIADIAILNYYWWDGVAAGIGYHPSESGWRVADRWRSGRHDLPGSWGKADTQEMDADAYFTPGGDGFVNLFDAARVNNDWHNYVAAA